MALISVSRLAVLATALSLSACACDPLVGQSAAELVRACGNPLDTFAAETSIGRQEEWLYDGDVYVGLVDGTVQYVLK